MISLESIQAYQGRFFNRGSNYLYLPPHPLLSPYIANYTFSVPSLQAMPDEYTVLPTASSTLVASVSAGGIISRLRGVNTRACNVGAHANKMKLLVLVEFHPGGLCPFLRLEQSELVDASFALEDLDRELTQTLEQELMKSEAVEVLTRALDRILLNRMLKGSGGADIRPILNYIIKQHGQITARELSAEFYYSGKQIRRLFLSYVGTSPKTFARITRTNYALHLLQNHPAYLTEVALQAGFFDQPHFIHDFRRVCGLTPQDYLQNKSVFYNDSYKM